MNSLVLNKKKGNFFSKTVKENIYRSVDTFVKLGWQFETVQILTTFSPRQFSLNRVEEGIWIGDLWENFNIRNNFWGSRRENCLKEIKDYWEALNPQVSWQPYIWQPYIYCQTNLFTWENFSRTTKELWHYSSKLLRLVG